MSNYESMIKMKPDDSIYELRGGITYPSFKKYAYYSQTAGRVTNVNVLLPCNYSRDRKYPVLYILHGYYDSEDWMTSDRVHISTMLGNLIADGEAEEMIVVCPYIFCNKDMPCCTGMNTENTLSYDNFINDMMTDLMPFINGNFSVKTGRENTAITGFSMGGREALFIGVSHPEKFGYIGSVCTAPGLTRGTGDPWQLEEDELSFTESKPLALLISAAKEDSVVGNNPLKYYTILTNNGNEVLYHSIESAYHDPSSVSPHLYNFFRIIFR